MVLEPLGAEQEAHIEELVQHYANNREKYNYFLNGLRALIETHPLSDYVHSYKSRLKEPEHLRDKLRRKMLKAASGGPPFDITSANLFEKINDLAGLRILHLYTRQLGEINRHLQDALAEAQLPLVEGPFARTWDDEYRAFFQEIGIETRDSVSMYTSVHYIVEANTRTKLSGEIQVRTLAEELWGEVDHTINYPHPSSNLPCVEQIRVLARVTSSCTRLVDSIFLTHENGG